MTGEFGFGGSRPHVVTVTRVTAFRQQVWHIEANLEPLECRHDHPVNCLEPCSHCRCRRGHTSGRSDLPDHHPHPHRQGVRLQ